MLCVQTPSINNNDEPIIEKYDANVNRDLENNSVEPSDCSLVQNVLYKG
jgi:hypothetical protein